MTVAIKMFYVNENHLHEPSLNPIILLNDNFVLICQHLLLFVEGKDRCFVVISETKLVQKYSAVRFLYFSVFQMHLVLAKNH